jgi:outer membrane protein assembly factor BamB
LIGLGPGGDRERYYIVVLRSRCPISWATTAIAIALLPAAIGMAQRPPRPAPALAGLLPAEEAWSVALPFPPSAPGALDAARVYLPLDGEHLVALDRETGETRWTAAVESAWPPVVDGPLVFVAASDELHALDARSGERQWRAPLLRGAMTPLVVADGLLLTTMSPDQLSAHRAGTGEVLWSRAFGGGAGAGGMAAAESAIAITLSRGRVVCLGLADGLVRWERQLPETLTPPAVGRDRVVVGSTDNGLYALHLRTGALEWRVRAGGDVVGAAIDGDGVYFTARDNMLRALNLGNGNQRWKRALAVRPARPPQVLDGVVLVTGTDSTLATFATATGLPIATHAAPTDLVPPVLVDPSLAARRVAMVAVTSRGRALGLRPVALMLREPPLVPLPSLPGRALDRERLGRR